MSTSLDNQTIVYRTDDVTEIVALSCAQADGIHHTHSGFAARETSIRVNDVWIPLGAGYFEIVYRYESNKYHVYDQTTLQASALKRCLQAERDRRLSEGDD